MGGFGGSAALGALGGFLSRARVPANLLSSAIGEELRADGLIRLPSALGSWIIHLSNRHALGGRLLKRFEPRDFRRKERDALARQFGAKLCAFLLRGRGDFGQKHPVALGPDC